MKQLRKRAFRKWLEGKNPADKVGLPRRACHCPIAQYLREHGAANPSVGVTSWRDVGVENLRPTPMWAQQFIDTVDDINDYVSASRALKILDDIE